ncbi:MAG: glycogen debranching enzyme [Syntrophorhabdus sp. PtaU1.Bin050]|nr:MAG: glycogen debranching enzyme [Syntrophorhabdus sp. PtaU1.Bin050]
MENRKNELYETGSHPWQELSSWCHHLPEGVNFSIFSKQSDAVELLFFDRVDGAKPCRVVELDRGTHRTYHYRHVFVPGISAGQYYAYRVSGSMARRCAQCS